MNLAVPAGGGAASGTCDDQHTQYCCGTGTAAHHFPTIPGFEPPPDLVMVPRVAKSSSLVRPPPPQHPAVLPT